MIKHYTLRRVNRETGELKIYDFDENTKPEMMFLQAFYESQDELNTLKQNLENELTELIGTDEEYDKGKAGEKLDSKTAKYLTGLTEYHIAHNDLMEANELKVELRSITARWQELDTQIAQCEKELSLPDVSALYITNMFQLEGKAYNNENYRYRFYVS